MESRLKAIKQRLLINDKKEIGYDHIIVYLFILNSDKIDEDNLVEFVLNHGLITLNLFTILLGINRSKFYSLIKNTNFPYYKLSGIALFKMTDVIKLIRQDEQNCARINESIRAMKIKDDYDKILKRGRL